MRNNQNYYKILEEDICCCSKPKPCDCGCKEPTVCSENAKTEWEKYLESEKCQIEPEVTFNICDYDPDQVYFMQYLSPRSLIGHTWISNKIFDDSFDKTFE